ncbi:GTP cyclohydrolase II [Georgenia sp. SYP-B2076]|uniref:GTP cyclohydrolase II n=1 Tax=Georgenia sp. SYP-B2076 TaxID=2495881 RepID=UPI000F8D74C9|nr:GTP cyclohydrolase II [Georgenia sp. SYP-B2076]
MSAATGQEQRAAGAGAQVPEGRAAGRVEAALEALRRGRPVLVVDDPDRENEADVILAASATDERWVAWTIRHTSGYLCAPMPAARADALALPLMVPDSQDPRRTAYTVSVDAARGVTTGISAADRTRTLKALADPASGPGDLIRPGHVLPLRAVPGGVLDRAGHTEAAVDLCRLAGVGPVAAIAELVNDDGTMMRHEDAGALARAEGLVLLTIADLVAWRREHDDPGHDGPGAATAAVSARVAATARVHATGTATLPTAFGTFAAHGYRDLRTGAEHLAIVADPPAGAADRPPLVRVHSECLTGDAFASLRCDCGPQLHAAMRRAADEGGVVVYLGGHEGRGIGLLEKISAYGLQDTGLDTVEANLRLGWPVDGREFGAAAAILADLGLGAVRLMTNNPDKVDGLCAGGIAVSEVVGLEVGLTEHNRDYLMTKRTAMGHHLPGLGAPGAETFEREER